MSAVEIIDLSKMERELARVRSVQIGPEGHGIFTFWIHLDFCGCGQGFGGYALDEWSERDDRRIGSALGMDMLIRLFTFFGVNDLGNAKGQAVYALREGALGQIHALQRIEPDGGAIYYPRQIVAEWEARS